VSASRYEDIIEAFRTRLASIVAGATILSGSSEVYNYTPDRVVRAHALQLSFLDSSLSIIYFLVPDRRTPRLADVWVTRADVSLDIVCCQKFEPATEEPLHAEAPIRETLVSKMARDIEAALAVKTWQTTLSGSGTEVWNIQVANDDRNAEVTHLAKWAVGVLNATFTYQYREAA